MKPKYSFAWSLIFLLVSVWLMNWVYTKWFYLNDLKKYSEGFEELVLLNKETEVLYLGESSNITTAGADADRRSISEMVSGFYPSIKLSAITKPASHAGVYAALLEGLPNDVNPKAVIVTLNLRSFNAQWVHSNLEDDLQKQMLLIRPYPPILNRALLSFKHYTVVDDSVATKRFKTEWKKPLIFPFSSKFPNTEKWDSIVEAEGIGNPDGSKNYAVTELACHYIKAYSFTIDTIQHPRINDVKEIIRISKKRGFRLIFNLLAENTEMAERLGGPELMWLIKYNHHLLLDFFRKRDIQVVDNLFSLPNEVFIDQKWTTEHYNEQGRFAIAGNLATALKRDFPKAFKGQKLGSVVFRTVFINTCDEQVKWGQMQTITESKFYSSPRSSVCGDGSEYSLTFEFAMQEVPDSLRSFVEVDAMLWITEADPNIKFVLQTEGSKETATWQGIEVGSGPVKTKTWQRFKHTFQIPEAARKAKVIKAYVFNPTHHLVYLDDFKVVFK